MRIRDLEWLAALGEYGQVTDAAAVLGVSQPTLSRALARAEAELGVRLFERVPEGLVPSAFGAMVLDGSRELVERYERLLVEIERRKDPDRGVVRLAFLDSMATSLVPRVLRDFHQKAPAVRVELSQEPGHAILDDLLAGRVDVAITSPRPLGEFGWATLQTERLCVIVPPTHQLARRKRIRLLDVAREQLITTPKGFGHRSLVDGLLTEAGVEPEISFESADLATIEGLVAAGLGVAIVPEAFAGLSGTIGLSLANPRARRRIGLIWRADRALDPAPARFRDFVVAGAPYDGSLTGIGAAR